MAFESSILSCSGQGLAQVIKRLTPTHASVIAAFLVLGIAVMVTGSIWPYMQFLVISGFLILILIFLVLVVIDLRTNVLLLESVHESQVKAGLDNIFSQYEALLILNALISGKPGLPQSRHWAASPDFLVQIYKLIEKSRPKVILELGSGLTTIVTAYALRNLNYGGILHSVDHSHTYLEKSRREVERHGLGLYVKFHEAPLIPMVVSGQTVNWYDTRFMQELSTVNLLIIDGPPLSVGQHARYPALPLLEEKLSRNALVLLDDADREDEQAVVLRWLRESPDYQKVHIHCEKGCTLLKKTQ